jgi:uncharacterized membrane protein YkvA (DUF1232 family)
MLKRIKEWARAVKRDTIALTFAARDRRVPWYAKAFMGLVLAYALSPIDLIPDFIPILGYADDLIILPAGIALAIKMIPTEVMEEARELAEDLSGEGKQTRRAGALIVIVVWMAVLSVVGVVLYRLLK